MPGGRTSAVDSATLRCPCEWSGCGLLFNSLSILQEHQLDHFKEQYCHQNLSYFITCRICEAQLDTADFDAIERHSHYHVWTLSLRVYGQHVQQMNEWPDCLHTPSACAIPPNLLTKFECVWKYCNFSTNDVFAFYDHVSEHPEEYTDSRYARDTPLRCLWGGCGYVANWLKNLHNHLDMHTQRKHIGCPKCGMLFESRVKFEDHLNRQQGKMSDKPIGVDGSGQLYPSVNPVSCLRCPRTFVNKSLLITHMKRHIDRIKCQFCDVTVWGNTELNRHVLLRHTEERRFPCPHCDYRSKTSSALKCHIQQTHFARATIRTSRSQYRLVPGVDVDESAIASVEGQFAETDVMSVFDDVIGSPIGAGFTIDNSSSNIVNTGAAHDAETSIFCHVPGCRFKTTPVTDYRAHCRTKHLLAASSLQPSPIANRNGFVVSSTDVRLPDNLVSRAIRTASITSSAKAARARKDWIYCDQPGCKFKTTTRKGYGMHFSIKHMPRSPSPANEEDKVGYYVCHLCPEMRKKSYQMTKHLRKDHQLTDMRLMYTLGCDGKFRFQPNRPDLGPPEPPLVGKLPIARVPRRPVSPVRKHKDSTAPPVVCPVSTAPALIGQVSATPALINQVSAAPALIGQMSAPPVLGQVSAAPFLIGQLSTATPIIVQLSADSVVIGQLLSVPPAVGQMSAAPSKVRATPYKKRVAWLVDDKPAASARGRKPLAPVLLKLPITPLTDKVPILPVPVGKVPISRLVKHAPLRALTATPTRC